MSLTRLDDSADDALPDQATEHPVIAALDLGSNSFHLVIARYVGSDFQFIERFRKVHQNFYVIAQRCQQDFSNDDESYTSQINRFKYFCEGARNSEKQGIWDWLQYNGVVLMRALKLVMRHGKLNFITTYYRTFLRPS